MAIVRAQPITSWGRHAPPPSAEVNSAEPPPTRRLRRRKLRTRSSFVAVSSARAFVYGGGRVDAGQVSTATAAGKWVLGTGRGAAGLVLRAPAARLGRSELAA